MRSFERILVVDLHGNSKKGERAPDGSKDENVFDIEQGVAISLFVKKRDLERGVWRADIWGERLDKYRVVADSDIDRLSRTMLAPDGPDYLFLSESKQLRQEYETGVQITQIFKVGVLGFQSHRDDFAISFAEKEMRRRLAEFVNPAVTDDDLSRRYGLKDNRDWSLSHARKAALEEQNDGVMKVDYRPFDTRWGEFSEIAMDYPRRELLDHVAHRDNQCLNVVRQTKARNWQHVLVSDKPTPAGFIEIKDGSTVFPLRLFRWSGTGDEVGENFKTEFRSFVDSRYARHYLPEEILGYIYAVLHAPFYRTRYSEFLRTNFPRIPFAEMPADFIALSKLGWQLVDAHLLRDVPQRGFAQYNGKGDHAVEAVRYSQVEQAIWINASQRFAPVPQNVWDFHIGGYRVLEKYLKSRKGRKLSLDEINHVAQVADSLAFTIEQMAKIDTAYKAAFPDRG